MSPLLVLCLSLMLFPGPLAYCVESWLEDLWANLHILKKKNSVHQI